ncbi:MAG TPA: hypothetical protein VM599_04110 [Thermoanaerobaculia bacterium]|nr:hypothetical protein [Thermoanaerobaculia bacterium]
MSPRTSILIPLLLALAACAGEPEDPAERVAEARAGYTARLNSYAVDQVPLDPAPAPTVGPPGEAGTAGEPLGETAEAEAPVEVPLRQDVILDILVSREGHEALPGITVDVTQADSRDNEKASWKVYLDTSDLFRGPGVQMVHRLEDVVYEEGDGFFVEVRHPIPAAERGEYRELREPAEGAP